MLNHGLVIDLERCDIQANNEFDIGRPIKRRTGRKGRQEVLMQDLFERLPVTLHFRVYPCFDQRSQLSPYFRFHGLGLRVRGYW